MARIFVVVPTFKEPDSLQRLFTCFVKAEPRDTSLLIVNANNRDESSRIIDEYQHRLSVREVKGDPSLFWSGLVNLGIKEALALGGQDDFLVLMNVDVEFEGDIFETLQRVAVANNPCQVGALACCGHQVITSGVQVKSWLLGLNRNPLAGRLLTDIPSDEVVDVDFLPTRCILIPLAAVRQTGPVDARHLPHYGGDYEYTFRLKRLGWRPLIHTGTRIQCDVRNTGAHAFNNNQDIARKLQNLLSVKCGYNPLYRAQFVWRTYPVYARLPATMMYLAKTVIECSGGPMARRLAGRMDGAYAGRGE